MFDVEFIDAMPDNPIEGAFLIIEAYKERHRAIPSSEEISNLHEYIIAYTLLSQHLDLIGLGGDDLPSGDSVEILRFIISFFNQAENRINEIRRNDEIALKRRAFAERLATRYKNAFAYEFTEGDLKEIQEKVNKLRHMISGSNYLEEGFKRRLLSRLEYLQDEIYKRMSDLDRFWGLLGDAGVAVGRFGEEAKPLFDRVRELLDTVWKTQARAEELPSRTPLPELERKKSGAPVGRS